VIRLMVDLLFTYADDLLTDPSMPAWHTTIVHG
jgi:hypothetical protein